MIVCPNVPQPERCSASPSGTPPADTRLTACGLLKEEGRRRQDAGQAGSKGCGATLRVAPIGLAPGLRDEQRAGAAPLQSALAASRLTAHAVRLSAADADPAGLVGQLRAYAVDHRTRYDHTWLGALWTRSQDPSPEHFVARGRDECLADRTGRIEYRGDLLAPGTLWDA